MEERDREWGRDYCSVSSLFRGRVEEREKERGGKGVEK